MFSLPARTSNKKGKEDEVASTAAPAACYCLNLPDCEFIFLSNTQHTRESASTTPRRDLIDCDD
jgi:hypothetical protein